MNLMPCAATGIRLTTEIDMRTAKQILEDFKVEAALINNHADLKAFREQYLQRALDEARKEGLVEGLTRFAWWKDGVRYVGTCGTTLKKAIEDIGRSNDPVTDKNTKQQQAKS